MSDGSAANTSRSGPDLRRVACNPGYWHPVAQSRKLKRNKTLAVTFAGEPIVLIRTDSGKVFALEDRCAHRQGWPSESAARPRRSHRHARDGPQSDGVDVGGRRRAHRRGTCAGSRRRQRQRPMDRAERRLWFAGSAMRSRDPEPKREVVGAKLGRLLEQPDRSQQIPRSDGPLGLLD